MIALLARLTALYTRTRWGHYRILRVISPEGCGPAGSGSSADASAAIRRPRSGIRLLSPLRGSRFYCEAGGLADDHDPASGRCLMVPGCGR